MSNKLTLKQEMFCQKYIECDGNQSEAYRQSYDCKNCSPHVINNESGLLMKHEGVAARIEELTELRLKRHQTTVDRVIAEYAKIAFLDPKKVFYPDGRLRPLDEMDNDTAAAIGGIEIVEQEIEDSGITNTVKKIKLVDKKGALDSLAKCLAMFTEKRELSTPENKPLEIKTKFETPEEAMKFYQQVIKNAD